MILTLHFSILSRLFLCESYRDTDIKQPSWTIKYNIKT